MVKSQTKTMPESESARSLSITYNLSELPSAFHKAGLAGLVLVIRFMEKVRQNYPNSIVPVIENLSATSVTIQLTEQSTRNLFDEAYASRRARVEVASKWQGQEPIDIIVVEEMDRNTKKPKSVRKFVYETTQPLGRSLETYFGGDRADLWLKLWRDML